MVLARLPRHGAWPILAMRNWALSRRLLRSKIERSRSTPRQQGPRMKAIVIRKHGPPDVLTYEDLPDPEPRHGEIRIRIHAATVNRVLDVNLRAGKEGAR